MNKKNKILVGCLALLLVLSVGYALFGETVTINGTATAKGDFDITVTALTDSEIDTEGLVNATRGMVTSSSIDINDNVVTTNVVLGMPGSQKNFVVKVENTGTIPAFLKSVTDEKDNVYESGASGLFAGKTVQNTAKTSTIYVDLGPDMNYMSDYENQPFGPDYTLLIDDVSSAILNPGEFTYYYIAYSWADGSTSGEQMSLSWTAKLNWEQLAN